jgi:hypothetical protein
VSVPDTTNLDLLLEGPSSQKQHCQQRVVGGGKQAQGWQVGRVSHLFDVSGYSKHSKGEQAFPSPDDHNYVATAHCYRKLSHS